MLSVKNKSIVLNVVMLSVVMLSAKYAELRHKSIVPCV